MGSYFTKEQNLADVTASDTLLLTRMKAVKQHSPRLFIWVTGLLIALQWSGCVVIDCNGEKLEKNESINYVPDQLLVLFKPGIDQARIDAINELLHTQVIRTMFSGRLMLVRIPSGQSLQKLRRAYASFSEVEAVTLNYRTTL